MHSYKPCGQPLGVGTTPHRQREDIDTTNVSNNTGNTHISILAPFTFGSPLPSPQAQSCLPPFVPAASSAAAAYNTYGIMAPTPSKQKPSGAILNPTPPSHHMKPTSLTNWSDTVNMGNTDTPYPSLSSSFSPPSTEETGTLSVPFYSTNLPNACEYDPAIDFEIDEAFIEDYIYETARQAEEDAEFAKQLQQQFDHEAAQAPELTSEYLGLPANSNDLFPTASNQIHSPSASFHDSTNRSNGMDLDHSTTSATYVSNEDEGDVANIPADEKMNLEQLRQYTTSLSIPCAGCAGREFAVWALACGWDQPAQISLRETVTNKLRPRRPLVPDPRAVQDALKDAANRPRTHRASATAKGTGYGSGHYIPFARHKISKPTNRKPADSREEVTQEAYFRLMTALLPTLESPEPGMMDSTPPIHLHTMLARSPLMAKAATLLSNDSIEEISKQRSVYDAVLNFVNVLGNHYATSGLVYEERHLFTKWGTTISVSFDIAGRAGKKTTAKDTGKPMTEILSRLAKQGRTMLQHARQNPQEFESQSEKEELSWVEKAVQISALHDINSRQLQHGTDVMDIDEGKGKNPMITDWFKFHQDHAVQELDDEHILRNHYFANQAMAVQGKPPPKGRMKRLIREISTLKTSLPEGIFIHHGSSRLDVMKVLIIGPEGTPYEYGLFEFDLFCPLQYPIVAPMMHFKTTGGGKIRFNPNLYEDGKVCLSLLGTWQGEPWQPDKSTILQLVVSIQSMIFCENPYYNEPGFEMRANEDSNTKYSNDRRVFTIQYAIHPWVRAVSATLPNEGQANVPTEAWTEHARTHLQLSAHKIVKSATAASEKHKNHVQLEVQTRTIGSALQKQGYLI
ncbi:hypothetical protein TruAng_001056 [Truncatella angustata]|nr:hypothetical protein TruAng_001056 [Truncatella angustata]